MAETTSTLSTERTTGTWPTQLTTIELHHMAATMSLVTSFVKLTQADPLLIHQYTSLMSLSLPVVKPDVA